jgi:hypothetical protein
MAFEENKTDKHVSDKPSSELAFSITRSSLYEMFNMSLFYYSSFGSEARKKAESQKT